MAAEAPDSTMPAEAADATMAAVAAEAPDSTMPAEAAHPFGDAAHPFGDAGLPTTDNLTGAGHSEASAGAGMPVVTVRPGVWKPQSILHATKSTKPSRHLSFIAIMGHSQVYKGMCEAAGRLGLEIKDIPYWIVTVIEYIHRLKTDVAWNDLAYFVLGHLYNTGDELPHAHKLHLTSSDEEACAYIRTLTVFRKITPLVGETITLPSGTTLIIHKLKGFPSSDEDPENPAKFQVRFSVSGADGPNTYPCSANILEFKEAVEMCARNELVSTHNRKSNVFWKGSMCGKTSTPVFTEKYDPSTHGVNNALAMSYNPARGHGDPFSVQVEPTTETSKTTTGKCTHLGCSGSVVARGLCRKHGAKGKCTHLGCSSNVVAHGLCYKHSGKTTKPVPSFENLMVLCRWGLEDKDVTDAEIFAKAQSQFTEKYFPAMEEEGSGLRFFPILVRLDQ